MNCECSAGTCSLGNRHRERHSHKEKDIYTQTPGPQVDRVTERHQARGNETKRQSETEKASMETGAVMGRLCEAKTEGS